MFWGVAARQAGPMSRKAARARVLVVFIGGGFLNFDNREWMKRSAITFMAAMRNKVASFL